MCADGTMKLTLAGKSFYNQAKQEHIVSVPVTVRGKRKNGTPYARYLSIWQASVRLRSAATILTQKKTRIRSLVLRQLGERTVDNKTVLLEVSGEIDLYERDVREWQMPLMNMFTDTEGRTKTEVSVRVPTPAPGEVLEAASLPS